MINFNSYRFWILVIYISFLILNSVFTFVNPIYVWKYDKIIHFGEYFILGFLLFHLLYETDFSKRKMIYCILFISLIPITDEFAQNFSYLWGLSRVPSLYDVLADYLGCYTGCFFYYLTHKAYNG
jgi:VanZ family protein